MTLSFFFLMTYTPTDSAPQKRQCPVGMQEKWVSATSADCKEMWPYDEQLECPSHSMSPRLEIYLRVIILNLEEALYMKDMLCNIAHRVKYQKRTSFKK